MVDTRDHILAALRSGLARDEATQRDTAAAAQARLTQTTRGPLPALTPPVDLRTRFCRQLEAAAGHWHPADSPAAIVATTDTLCAGARSPLIVAPDPVLAALPWTAGVATEFRPIAAGDTIALTHAWAGIAETGTLVLRAGPHTPTTLNFLPDTLICLLEASCILPYLEDIWARQRHEGLHMPRALNLITGPSRTADVEQSIQIGAHGPRQLHVILST